RNHEGSRARQYNADFGKVARLSVDLDRPRMLLDNDVVTDRETKPSAFASRLSGEKRVEHLVFDLRPDALAVVPYPHFYPTAEVFGPSDKSRFKAVAATICLALGRCIEAVEQQ